MQKECKQGRETGLEGSLWQRGHWRVFIKLSMAGPEEKVEGNNVFEREILRRKEVTNCWE